MLMRYAAWADARLFDALRTAPPNVIDQPRPGRPSGLISTLAHIYVVDRIWRAHLEGQVHGFTTRNLDQPLPLAELEEAQHLEDHWYIAFVDAQSDESLAQVINFNFVDGGKGSLTRGDMLLHISNHKTYHRGYVADMLYESGLRPPTMDLPVFLRDAPPPL
jgi:uncharacterized damage-inducible protein DinB